MSRNLLKYTLLKSKFPDLPVPDDNEQMLEVGHGGNPRDTEYSYDPLDCVSARSSIQKLSG